MSDSRSQSVGADKYKYPAMAAVAVTALFFGYLWGNRSRVGELTIGEKGVALKVFERDGLEVLIDRVLGYEVDSEKHTGKPLSEDEMDKKYQKQALISHLASVVKSQSYKSELGQQMLKIAEASENPFHWEYVEAELRYDPTITGPVYHVCKDADEWKKRRLSVQVWNKAKGQFEDVGREYYALPEKLCPDATAKIVFTGIKSLVDESRKPGNLAKVRSLVTIPQ
ncbi:hypothetical protein [Synechococcus sp. BA-132 BA5]|uniref:hypothetical protein n=1 Tax=Synechococcus sp. BA-132 BA5 TaxID=3110252 RepID=UPI002B203B67|nr:hypothetical protein [Synechococcus sp. BA-132 BA5]MEA5416251.1 hypothetical protein [Synechococcus sp. BA-132 BA5]